MPAELVTAVAFYGTKTGEGADQMTIIASAAPTLAPAQFIGRLPVEPADIANLYR